MSLPKCPAHPKYQAKRPPKVCATCLDIYRLKQLCDKVEAAVSDLFEAAYYFFITYGTDTYKTNVNLVHDVKAVPRKQTAAPVDFDDYPNVKVKDRKAVLALHEDLCVGYPAGDHHGACSLWSKGDRQWQNP